MSDEIDLSGLSSLLLTAYGESNGSPSEQDPTERMTENQQQARERAESAENLREAEHEGEMDTDDFDLSEALERV